jgi:hypothetical protein
MTAWFSLGGRKLGSKRNAFRDKYSLPGRREVEKPVLGLFCGRGAILCPFFERRAICTRNPQTSLAHEHRHLRAVVNLMFHQHGKHLAAAEGLSIENDFIVQRFIFPLKG